MTCSRLHRWQSCGSDSIPQIQSFLWYRSYLKIQESLRLRVQHTQGAVSPDRFQLYPRNHFTKAFNKLLWEKVDLTLIVFLFLFVSSSAFASKSSILQGQQDSSPEFGASGQGQKNGLSVLTDFQNLPGTWVQSWESPKSSCS